VIVSLVVVVVLLEKLERREHVLTSHSWRSAMEYPERASTRTVGYGGCYERILAYRQLTTTRLDTAFVPAAIGRAVILSFFASSRTCDPIHARVVTKTTTGLQASITTLAIELQAPTHIDTGNGTSITVRPPSLLPRPFATTVFDFCSLCCTTNGIY